MGGRYENPQHRVKSIRRILGSLLQTYGYRKVLANDSVVRFETRKAYLAVKHGGSERLVDISFGPLREPGHSADTFDSVDLAELAKVPGQLHWSRIPARGLAHFEEILKGYIQFLRTRAMGVVNGDRDLFEFLAQRRRERGDTAVRQRFQSTVRPPPEERPGESLDESVPDLRSQPGEFFQSSTKAERTARLQDVEREAEKMLLVSLDSDRAEEWKVQLIGMEPHPMDYETVFTEEAASPARIAYRQMWNQPVVPPGPEDGHDQLKVSACYSDWFARKNTYARRFPEEFMAVAHMFKPEIIWLIWRYTGTAVPAGPIHDGLVWLGHCWAWFPAPYKYLSSG